MQYVKICDAYGAGFFYIPGTDTCLRVGGLVLADLAVSNTPNLYNGGPGQAVANGLGFGALVLNPTLGAAAIAGFAPGTFRAGYSRDAVAWATTGRIELDARTQSPWGTVRTFIRVDAGFGSGATANTGGLATLSTGATATISGLFPERESVVLNKAFIQFAGITMGRIQSMFDFYADAIGYTGLRGSNATVNGLAYTATFGGGFSATLSLEDGPSRRTAPYSTVVFNNFVGTGIVGTPTALLNGTRLPEIVANLRVDQPWGSAQISGALHTIRTGLYGAGLTTPAVPNGSLQVASANAMGFAVQAGVKFNLPMIAPGDALWLQATYAKGAVGYIAGNNLAFASGGINNQPAYGAGPIRVSSSNGWQTGSGDADCVWTFTGTCEKSSGFAVDAALKHYWTPTVSSTLVASYYAVNYSANALNPATPSLLLNAGAAKPFGWGATNYREFTLGAGLAWNPVAGFEIGGEFAWQHGVTSRPVGLAPDANLIAAGFQAYSGHADLYRGRIRMIRAF